MQLGATDSRVAVRWWWIVAHANSRRHVPWRKGVHVSLEMSVVCVRSLAAKCLLRAGLPRWFQVEAGGLRVCCCTAASCHCASSGAQTQTLSVLDFVWWAQLALPGSSVYSCGVDCSRVLAPGRASAFCSCICRMPQCEYAWKVQWVCLLPRM